MSISGLKSRFEVNDVIKNPVSEVCALVVCLTCGL